jgi:hypothetical protein
MDRPAGYMDKWLIVWVVVPRATYPHTHRSYDGDGCRPRLTTLGQHTGKHAYQHTHSRRF